jgi:hypothetical protein
MEPAFFLTQFHLLPAKHQIGEEKPHGEHETAQSIISVQPFCCNAVTPVQHWDAQKVLE